LHGTADKRIWRGDRHPDGGRALCISPRALSSPAVRSLKRNAIAEMVLAFSVVALDGVLGTLHPAPIS